MHRFKDRLAKGQLCRVFCVGRLIHPAVFDLHGMVGGYHGFWIDQEHAGVTYEQIVLASCAGRANGLDCFVRMPLTNYADATANLEAGAGGLMAARVESVEDAERFLQWVKFAPRGDRGMNASGYDCLYGGKPLPQFAVDANRDNFVAIQIETLGALEACEAIAAIDGVDLLFVGPSDLSQVLGVLGQWESPKLWDAIGRVAAACQKHGKQWGTIAVHPAFAQRAYERGCRMLSFGMDIVMLRRGLEATRTAFAALFERAE
jgi:2-dehydro-3-deoxyglucarate aldolase/4-hydroxy-2-oxoheptanedioate aldolase